MKSFFDKLNLRPAEARLVVAVGAILFVVVNLWFVVPHFGDLAKVQTRINKARKTKALFEAEIAQVPMYQARLRELESENLGVAAEEQSLHFANTRERVAADAGVVIATTQRVQSRTNQFFVELTQVVTLTTKEPQLVNFLHKLGSGNSLIRVRDLSLRPDPSRQQLGVSVKLAASYQKKSASRPATAVAAGGTTPSTAPSTKAPAGVVPDRAAQTRKSPVTAPGTPASTQKKS